MRNSIYYKKRLIHLVILFIDLNECDNGEAVCSPDSRCLNVEGSYDCVCNKGFQGDGKVCNDVDECTMLEKPCASNSQCSNSVGSYNCECKDGYEGDGMQTCEGMNFYSWRKQPANVILAKYRNLILVCSKTIV